MTSSLNMISTTKSVGLSLAMVLLLVYEWSIPHSVGDRSLPAVKAVYRSTYKSKNVIREEQHFESNILTDFDEPYDEEACLKMSQNVRLAPDYSMPQMALASFPRCGNSWTRKMLHIATGIYTGSVYEAITGNLSNTVCVKTHEFDSKTIQRFDEGAILLMRNPTLSLISEFFRSNKIKDPSLTEDDEKLMIQDESRWSHFVIWRVERWRSTNIDWIQYSKRLLVIFYEDLTADPARELSRMVRFLGQPVQPDRIRCAVKLNPLINQNHVDFKLYFPTVLEKYISDVNDTLQSHNYRPLPTYDLSFVQRP